MKKIILSFIIIFLCVPRPALAEREAPPEVAPVVFEGVRYEAPNASGKMGIVEAYDAATGKKLWEKKLYAVGYDRALEKDVQDVWIKELKVGRNKGWDSLLLKDELDRDYEIVIKGEKYKGTGPGEKVEVTFQYEIDDQGGKYFTINDELPYRRFKEFLPYIDSQNISKMTLVPLSDFKWQDSFFEERNRLVDIARENQYILEIKWMCQEKCECAQGMTSQIYDYQDKDVTIKTSKEKYAVGEEVPYTLINRAAYAKHFQVISAEKLIDDVWQEVMWNVPCTDCDPCTFLGQVQPGQQETWEWDQTVWDNGCVKASPGQYRFGIKELNGWPDESGCRSYSTIVYSNVSEITAGRPNLTFSRLGEIFSLRLKILPNSPQE